MLPLANLIQPGMKGAFYGRHSTAKQNMETQQSMAHDFAEKYGCTIAYEYLDPSVSARKKQLDDRPGVSQLLKDAIDGKFDFVLMNHHDRMARNPMEHQKIRMTLSGCNIPVVITSSESLYDSGDFIVDLIKDGTSKLEVDNTRIRTRDTARNILKQGKWTGGKAPFGYRYDKATKTFSQYEAELTIVRRVYELYRNREGFQSIASIVSHEFGKSINKSAVRWIITNPFYAGYMTHQRKSERSRNSITPMEGWLMIKSDLIVPIMSLEEWKETWAIYEQRKTGDLNPKMYKTSFYLSNLLSCAVCNQMLNCKDQSTTYKKTGKQYLKKWYCCPTCKYKIKSGRIHSVIDAVLNDLKSQNLETVSSLVYAQMLKERQLVAERLNKAKTELTATDNQLQLADVHSKRLASKVKDLETIDENTKMVQVLTLQKQQLSSRIIALQSEINRMNKSAQYLEMIEGNQHEITRNIKTMSIMTSRDNDHDIRKMITYLVQQAVFTPITIDSKHVVTKGDLAIQTRSSLVRTTIS
ncbi:recombinase family protein [Paenibacillus sp. KQZ6P-2]|uniref:Recombinase family protein n=1 Tax=Paenibacillus mangrovi TaxID=2931978 RepID=A0A9X2B385_9BACL|nr:recombinase family protein [Paenibacillus mangrovi]MCJ8013379.1 recombinase family protein [Paenibacillus mangrovi]